jgi:hypothetical protein
MRAMLTTLQVGYSVDGLLFPIESIQVCTRRCAPLARAHDFDIEHINIVDYALSLHMQLRLSLIPCTELPW